MGSLLASSSPSTALDAVPGSAGFCSSVWKSITSNLTGWGLNTKHYIINRPSGTIINSVIVSGGRPGPGPDEAT